MKTFNMKKEIKLKTIKLDLPLYNKMVSAAKRKKKTFHGYTLSILQSIHN